MNPAAVREAEAADSEALAGLIAELGFEAPAPDLRERIVALCEAGLAPLVAVLDDEVVGCLTYSVMEVLHRPAPVGRISMLIVTEARRGHGLGAALVAAAEARLKARGCGLVEVTSNRKLVAAHAFYERLGYARTSHRFAKPL